jgi:hypothetical protein
VKADARLDEYFSAAKGGKKKKAEEQQKRPTGSVS